jgi:hypothetical protein
MARLSSNRIAWQYHSDDGNTYRVAAEALVASQGKQGGEAWDGNSPPKPAWLKMRRVTVRSAAHGSRVVPIYTAGAAIGVAGATIQLNADTDSFVFTSSGNPLPENHIIHNVTQQSA